MTMETILNDLTKEVRLSNYDAVREIIKNLVMIGLTDKKLAEEILTNTDQKSD